MCYKIGMQIQIVLILLFVVAVTSACQTHATEKRSTKCILPPYPNHGRYEVAGELAAKPGDELEYVYLNVSCRHGHGVISNNVVLCILGEWSTTVPQCVPACYLQEHPSVTFSCKSPGVEEFKACSEYEPLKTFVKPECRPGYYSTAAMPPMRCVDGSWTYEAKCTPECGQLSGDGSTLPWFVSIYKSPFADYRIVQQLCAGNIISPNIVITAGHCFWDQDAKSVDILRYVVIVGKKFFSDTDSDDKFPVKDVKVTKRFQGAATYFQHDIALVILRRAFIYSVKLHPVCLNFDDSFKKKQMQEGNLGSVAVLTRSSAEDPKDLQVQWIPYIPVQKCIEKSPPAFREFITGDKFCAGRDNGTLICKGNSGSGLSFPENQQGVVRYFLQGLGSGAPRTYPECAPTDFALFTEIYFHKEFIQEHLATSLPPRVEG